MEGKILAVCTSSRKGIQKNAIDEIRLVRGYGIEGDAHAGNWHRQVSLLEAEKIEQMRAKGLELADGAFGENIVTSELDFQKLEVGRRFRIGNSAVLQMTQRGKKCHDHCAIYYTAGECIMPKNGIFGRVLRSGSVKAGDSIRTDPAFDRYRLAVLTLSDRGAEGKREDTSGPLVVEMLDGAVSGDIIEQSLLPDDRDALQKKLIGLCDEQICDLIITTGGTGLSPRDITPDVTLEVCEREIPGLAELMRLEGLKHTPRAVLSRGVCAQRGQCIVVNLSGSPKAVKEQLGALLPVLDHALLMATGIPQDCAKLAP